MSAPDILLVILALAFAWSMGAHYTGACMGMPFATKSINLAPALWLMAPLTFLGATFLSHKVLANIGHNILLAHHLDALPAIAILGAAFSLTTFFTQRRIPTSTIQILIFCVIGAGLALGLRVRWSMVLRLIALWISAPVIAFFLGFVFTKILDLFPEFARSGSAGAMGWALVVVGGAASITMGANDVSNATAVFLTTGFSGPLVAGTLGGIGLAIGVLTWGRPLLERVALDVVKVDMPMATAAQLVQAVVVLTAVFVGYFTSMNQALIGAMAGAGFARGRETIDRGVIIAILRGWFIGPGAGLILAFIFARVMQAIS
ncbi:MAG: anion permease [Alphaproteobacteria bacterium]|nr:anion permease [Alphaproteobacteria bacterium]